MAHLILSALLLYEGLCREGNALKRCLLRKKSTKNEDKAEKGMKASRGAKGCKFSTGFSVHYRVIRDEAGPDKGPQCC